MAVPNETRWTASAGGAISAAVRPRRAAPAQTPASYVPSPAGPCTGRTPASSPPSVPVQPSSPPRPESAARSAPSAALRGPARAAEGPAAPAVAWSEREREERGAGGARGPARRRRTGGGRPLEEPERAEHGEGEPSCRPDPHGGAEPRPERRREEPEHDDVLYAEPDEAPDRVRDGHPEPAVEEPRVGCLAAAHRQDVHRGVVDEHHREALPEADRPAPPELRLDAQGAEEVARAQPEHRHGPGPPGHGAQRAGEPAPVDVAGEPREQRERHRGRDHEPRGRAHQVRASTARRRRSLAHGSAARVRTPAHTAAAASTHWMSRVRP